MDPILDRRDDRERVRVRLAVELGQGDFRDAFEADALNVSRGGISVRAACLPDLHSRLLCRFQCTPGGASVTALGEVVWAHLDGEQRGEFGLAFVNLDPKTEWLIEEMLAEHAAQQSGRGPMGESGARVATLELEGSPEPIAARVAHNESGSAVFEQALDLLSLGRGVLAHADGWSGRAGNIAGVELRMVGSVPMLAVTVSFDGAQDEPSQPHDTEPDLNAPAPMSETQSSGRFGVTVADFGPLDPQGRATATARAQSMNRASEPPAWALSPLDHAPSSLSDDELDSDTLSVAGAAGVATHAEPDVLVVAERAALPARALGQDSPAEREFSRAFKLDEPATDEPRVAPDDEELDAELEAFSGPSYKPLFSAALRGLKATLGGLFGALSAASASGSRAAMPKFRGAFLRAGSGVRSLWGRGIGLRVGAARRMVGAALPARRRRTTAGPVGASAGTGATKRNAVQKKSSLGRTLVLGVLAAGAAGLAVYAFAPSKREDGLDLHRKVQALPATGEELGAVAEAAEPKAGVVAPPAAKPVVAVAAPAVAAAQAARPATAALPTEAHVPASSPFAVDVRNSAQAAKSEPARNKLRFGAPQVPKGRRFSLRMSARIQSLEGVPDKGGFTVSIPGCLSLDRAGPISSALKSVKRAMVVNKGDHAELSIRFADGKQPAYQLSAEGTTLYLLIEDSP